jgi:hypothetical protein
VTESTIDQTHALLLRVADFLKKLPVDQVSAWAAGEAQLILVPGHVADIVKRLPTDQVSELIAGEARLAVVPRGARVTGSAAARTPRTPRAPKVAMDSAQVAADLARIDDRAAATQYLGDLQLTAQQLKQLAKDLDIPVASKARKDEYIATMVGLLVGRRLEHDALIRNASAR